MFLLSDAQLAEVTSEVGFALWQIQILESAMGTYLVLVHRATPATARIEVEAMFAKAGKRTLGQLLQAIQATEDAPPQLTEQLDGFVEKRNWLVHHSRHESHSEMSSDIRRAALIHRIAVIAEDALVIGKEFQAATEAHLIALGRTKEQIDNEAARILGQWASQA